jgi:hypothetical protein
MFYRRRRNCLKIFNAVPDSGKKFLNIVGDSVSNFLAPPPMALKS